jgi:phosphohistidine phosphatase SixA
MTQKSKATDTGHRKGWRNKLALIFLVCASALHAGAALAESDWAALQEGTVVLFRHANAPGIGDPDHFKLSDCSTQRNLDDAGRIQARRIGEQFRKNGIAVRKVLGSQWCRARDTAQLAFPDFQYDGEAFDSFFNDAARSEAQTATALQLLNEWQGPGVLVVVTHQVNIMALTGLYTRSGEGLIVKPVSGRLQIVGRVEP